MARRTWIGAACAAILALGVAACGGDDNSSTSSGSSSSASSAKKNYKMTLIAGVKGDEFYITMNCGAQAKAKELGVTLDFQGPDKFDAGLQTPVVNAVAAKKPDAVLVAPTDTKAMYAPIKQLSDNGAKVALVDTTLEQPTSRSRRSRRTTRAAASRRPRHWASSSAARARSSWSTSSRASRPPTCAPRFRGGRQGGRPDLRRPAVRRRRPVEGRRGDQGRTGQEPRPQGHLRHQPVLRRGRRDRHPRGGQAGPGEDRRLRRRPKQVEDLKTGTVQALIAQKPADIGAEGVQQAYNALTGKPTEKKIGTGFTSLTKDNLAENPDAPYKASC
jgi:ribose transport system substrate-binding protein